MVALVGEPGIGKTRTAQGLGTYASMRGGQVLWGRCYEGGGAPPYWPWVQAIRSYVTERDAATVRQAMGSTASVISEIVPDVKERLPDVQPPQQLGDAESARFRLFDSIATFLKTASATQPMVLMLVDLHWSDRPSLMLLEFVARELGNSHLMIVGNYRDVDLNRRHPLSITLGELTRERLYDRVVLRGLQKHDVRRFIEVAAGIEPSDALVDVVHTQTEGNPLFVTETVRLLIQQGDISSGGKVASGTSSWEIQIPEGIREVIGRRLDRLSDRTNETLTIAAVIGRQFSFDALQELVEDTSESQLLDVLDEALDARVIEELPTDAGVFQFTHALIEQTLVEELSLTRRVRLHARIALVLETLYGDHVEAHASQLAHHYAEAVTVLDEEKMVRYSILAAKAALTAYAYEEVRTHFERALGGEDQVEADADSAAILFGLGRAEIALLDFNAALTHFGKAFEYYERAGDVERAIEIGAYPLPAALGVFPGATDLAERALVLVPPDSHEAGQILPNYLGLVGLQYGDYEITSRALDQAIAIARREDDHALEFKTLAAASITVLYHTLWTDREIEISRICDRGIELSESIDDPGSEAMVCYVKGLMHLQIGEIDAAVKMVQRSLRAAERSRDRSLMSRTNFLMAFFASTEGDWATARENTDQAISYHPRDPRPLFIRSLVEYETGNEMRVISFLIV